MKKSRFKTKEMPDVNFFALGISGGVDTVREMVRIRDNRTCQICKKVWVEGSRRFDVHHLDEELESSDNKPHLKRGRVKRDRENMHRMITYCHKCHLNLHTVREKIRKGMKKAYKTRKDNSITSAQDLIIYYREVDNSNSVQKYA